MGPCRGVPVRRVQSSRAPPASPGQSRLTGNKSQQRKESTMSAAGAVNLLTDAKLDQLCVNTIRTLSIDAVQQAKSGHPGTPMALAPLIYTIWNRVLRFDPQDPIWPNR